MPSWWADPLRAYRPSGERQTSPCVRTREGGPMEDAMALALVDEELEVGKSPGATRRVGGDEDEDGGAGRARKNLRLPSKASRT